MSCYCVNLFDFRAEKIARALQRECSFSAQNQTNQHSSKTCIALIMHLLSIQATKLWEMLMNNKFKAQTLNGNPTGNYRCQIFTSRALNMSCYFSQSARSIEKAGAWLRIIINRSFCHCQSFWLSIVTPPQLICDITRTSIVTSYSLIVLAHANWHKGDLH